MLNSGWLNVWVLGPAIGFGIFLVVTLVFSVSRTQFRGADNISFLVFAVLMLLSSSSLLFLIHGLSDVPTPFLYLGDYIEVFFNAYLGFSLLMSLAYFVFVQFEVYQRISWVRIGLIVTGMSVILPGLYFLGGYQLFPAYNWVAMDPWQVTSLLISGGWLLAASICYLTQKPNRFLFFGFSPALLLIGVSLNPLFLGPGLVSTMSIWLVYFGLLYTTIVEGLVRPNLARAAEVEALNLELVDAYDTTLEGWAKALELHDKETQGHSQRVTDLALRLAKALDVPAEDLQDIRFGALLHDVGKMALPDAILKKPGPLTPEERALVNEHPISAYHMLKDIRFLEKAIQIPLYHHERWDGSGYPEGRAGEDVPLYARMFAVVDVWDAVTSRRPYGEPWTTEEARAHLLEGRGKLFDPVIVDVFLRDVLPPQT